MDAKRIGQAEIVFGQAMTRKRREYTRLRVTSYVRLGKLVTASRGLVTRQVAVLKPEMLKRVTWRNGPGAAGESNNEREAHPLSRLVARSSGVKRRSRMSRATGLPSKIGHPRPTAESSILRSPDS